MSVIITDLRRSGRTKLYEVFSESGSEFIAGEKFLNQNGILLHAEFNEEDFEVLKAKAQLIHGIRTAMNILELKDRSRRELLRKLKEKKIEDDVAVMAADYVRDKGYQDDYRYGLRLAQIASQSYGRLRVETVLYEHGLDRDLIRQISEEIFGKDDPDEAERIDAVLKKAARGCDPSDPAIRNKLYAKLARRGYESAAITAALERLVEERKDESI